MTKTPAALITITALALLGMPHAVAGGEVPQSPNDIQPVGTGDAIPAATVKTVAGDDLDLADVVAEQPAVLIFYRGGW